MVLAQAFQVTLPNKALPRDQNGDEIFTGEGSTMKYGNSYYFYFNDWTTTCPGVDCCNTSEGCAGHCYGKPDQPPYVSGCADPNNGSNPYGLYHIVRVYKTEDFKVFENLGTALELANRPAGIIFRPHVIFNKNTGLFVMWLDMVEQGYRVATAAQPEGPFKVVSSTAIPMPGQPQNGDYHLFVDSDGSAYHLRRSAYVPTNNLTLVKLSDDFTAPDSLVSTFAAPKLVEAPVLFKREGFYYALSGIQCCACIVGSNMYVHRAASLAGPWTLLGDVGSIPGVPFDPHNPHLYVTQAQGSSIFEVPSPGGGSTFVWWGNQWNSGLEVDPLRPRNHDFLYWAALEFATDGTIQQLKYTSETTFEMDPTVLTEVMV